MSLTGAGSSSSSAAVASSTATEATAEVESVTMSLTNEQPRRRLEVHGRVGGRRQWLFTVQDGGEEKLRRVGKMVYREAWDAETSGCGVGVGDGMCRDAEPAYVTLFCLFDFAVFFSPDISGVGGSRPTGDSGAVGSRPTGD